MSKYSDINPELLGRKVRDIVGLPIVDLSTGNEIGTIKECFYDSTCDRVLGFSVGPRGGNKAESCLHFSDLRSLGEDLAVVDSKEVFKTLDEFSESAGCDQSGDVEVLGKQVITDDGRNLGTIRDLILDSETGLIVGYEVSESIIQDILSGRSVIPKDCLATVGVNSVIIPEAAAPREVDVT